MPRVYVVDDDQALTSLLKTLLELEAEEFDVEIIPLGEDAFHTGQTSPPDIFIIDYHLKDMIGLELVQLLREQAHLNDVPIIVSSGLDVEAEAYQAGADLFLPKPFEPGNLAGIIMDLIG